MITHGLCIFLIVVSWKATILLLLLLSTMEAENMAILLLVKMILGFKGCTTKGVVIYLALIIYCDSQTDIYLEFFLYVS